MQVRLVDSDPLAHDTPLLAVPVPEGTVEPDGFLARMDAATGGDVARALRSGDMKGRVEDELFLYGPGGGPARFVLLGVGKPGAVDAEVVRRLGGRTVRAAERLRVDRASLWLGAHGDLEPSVRGQAAAEGAVLAAWRFTELKGPPREGDPPVSVASLDLFAAGDVEAVRAGMAAGEAIARGENLARTLQSRPGNLATPSHLAAEAERMAAEVGLAVTILDEARLAEEGMHAILAVSRGSHEEARLIVLEHRGGAKGDPPLVLVGKGLTFDAGGLSLKPAAGMEDMKFDMSGGAAVIGAMRAIAELGVPANVVGIVPSSENLPSGTALKPGDVIRTLAGKTVEVVNTDAEGRLILADALAWGARLGPAAMVDCATLTGAVVVGLGHHAAAVLGNDEALVEELRAAGTRSGERCWPLPLWDEYRKQLESETADLVNVGGRPAGTITAACFLSEFVSDAKWAHLDIAGTAYGDGKLPYQRKGGYGFPTRLLVEWVRSRAG
ncbi:MAG TPA: leucyl aminopeptidase [Longimicrobiales bacterium]|nr:leucyl aminopeptidase [Longimicrobiales bacterium]